jgi:hypothetical protein
MSPEKLLNDSSAERLYFGKFGGFTNIPVDYVLINNEHVFKIENDKYTYAVKISKTQSGQIRNLLKEAGLPALQLNEPGNMTYYIRMTSTTSEHEIKWTDQTQNPKVWNLYKALLSTLNQ